MDTPKTPLSDPSILLLNEIEILLAQSRLLELYLKQSQATAAYETARAYGRHQSELAELHAALAEKEQIVAAKENAVGARERHLQERVQSLEAEVSESQRRFQHRDAEFQRVESEAADLRRRIEQLELSKAQAQSTARDSAAARLELAAELAALRQRLEENQESFQKEQRASRELQDDLQIRIAQLQEQLHEKVTWSRNADGELQQAKREIAELNERVAELQTSRQEAEASAARELAESRTRFERQLNSIQTVLAEREHALEANHHAMAEIEHGFKTEILTLRSQLEQKQELIDFRDEELRVDQSQIAALQQRVAEHEAGEQAARATADQIEDARRSYEDQVVALQHEVTTRERALTERQEAVSAVELALHGKIQSLQQELAHSHGFIEERENALQSSRAETEALRERIAKQESNSSADLQALQLAEERCRGLETEISALHATLAQKEYALNEREKTLTSLEQRLSSEIDQLHRQLEKQQASTDASAAELNRLRAEIAAIEEQKSRLADSREELERSRQQEAVTRQELEARLQAKDDELRVAQANAQERIQAALREQDAHFKSLGEQTGVEIVGLRNQLQEQELSARQAHTEIAGLREQIAQTEHSRDELEQNLQQAGAQREELVTRLQTKEDEFRTAQAHASEQLAALEEQKARFNSIEEERRKEISELHGQLEQQRTHADSLHEELTRLCSENAGIQEQRAQSERLRQEFEQNRQEASALREQLETRLLARDAELQAAQSGATALKNDLDAKINELQLHLAQKQLLAEGKAAEIETFKGQVDQLSEQLTQRESTSAEFQTRLQRETELARADYQAAIAELRNEYSIKQTSQANELVQERQRVAELTLQIGEFERQKAAIETQLQERQQGHETVAVEAAALRSRLDELETRRQMELSAAEREQNQVRSQLEAELATARTELQQNASMVAQHQAAIAALQNEYQIKQTSQDNALAQERQRVAELTLQIGEFERQKAAIETQLQERQQGHETVAVEAAALRSRLDELETRRQMELSGAEQEQNQIRSQLETELTAARSELQQKAWALAQHQAALENLALAHKDQIQKLEGKITEQQNGIKGRNLELERSQSQARLLEQHIEELSTELRQAELTAINRAVQIKEEYGVRIADLERQVAQKTIELQERGVSRSEAEETLRLEIGRLIREAQERHQILQDRNEELVRVKAEMDTFQEQCRNLESTASQNEASLGAEMEKMRTEFQAQLALLQAELSQREWALEEQRAAKGTIELQFRQNLETLNQQLAETEARAKENQDKFVMGDAQLTNEQQERYKKYKDIMDAVAAGNDASFPASENRRWRGRFGWKRRWKS